MKHFHKFWCFVLFQISSTLTKHVVSNSTNSDNIKSNYSDGRRSGQYNINNYLKTSDEKLVIPKVETKTYSTHVMSGDNGNSARLHEWVSRANEGNVISEPHDQNIVQPCERGDTEEQKSILQKNVENSNTANDISSIDLLQDRRNIPLQSVQNAIGVVESFDEPSSLSHGSPTTNYVNDLTRRIFTGYNQGVNNMYNGIHNFKEHNLLFPNHDSYNVPLSLSGDGIHVNEVTEQPRENLNIMRQSESNSQNLITDPVMKTHLGRYYMDAYRPNMKHYLGQPGTSNLLTNPSAIKVPSFIEYMKPNQMYTNLSEDQLDSYKQYLINTGLINLKPYQLVFSNQFKPHLRSMQWTVVPLESDLEKCKKHCDGIFPRDTLYDTVSENARKLPLKLLVPVLKVRNGLKKSVTGVRTIADGVGDITSGMYKFVKDSPSYISGLFTKTPDGNKYENTSD